MTGEPVDRRIGVLHITHEKIEEAKARGIDLVAVRQQEIRDRFPGYQVFFRPRRKPPVYVVYEKYPSTNFSVIISGGEEDV